MTKNTNSKQKSDSSDFVSVIEISNLEFIWNLMLVIWDFAAKYKTIFS
jgi:hypothetical protein